MQCGGAITAGLMYGLEQLQLMRVNYKDHQKEYRALHAQDARKDLMRYRIADTQDADLCIKHVAQ